MNYRFRQLAILFLMGLLTACANVTTPAPAEVVENELALPQFPNLFGARPLIPEPATVQRLTPEQEQDFLTYFNSPQNQAVKPYLRVANYLFENTLTLQYEGHTYTAAQTLAFNKGDCLSLAILTSALAKLANVDIRYQLVDSNPVFGLASNLVYKGVHVKSIVSPRRSEKNSATVINQQLEWVVIDYFVERRGRFIGNISDDEFIAMYYLNVAGEALEREDYTAAYWHTLEALNYSPLDETAWNMMAVVYRRAGELAKADDYMDVVVRATHDAKAEEIYLFAIEHADDKLTLLKNYRLLLTSQMRTAEAAAIEQRLNSMEDPSPFHWFLLARNSYGMKDFAAAIRYFDKALKIAPYLHEAHLGKAQSFYQMGSIAEAELALKMAIVNVDRSSTRSLYEAKLMALARN